MKKAKGRGNSRTRRRLGAVREVPEGPSSPRLYDERGGTTDGAWGKKGSTTRDVVTPGMEGRWHNSDVDAWNDVRWHELAGCGAWCDGMV